MRAPILAALLALGACRSGDPSPAAERPIKGKVEFVAAPAAGDIAPYVVAEVDRAKKDGKDLLVYVGAAWCEPCKRFHVAAEKGELDEAFSKLRVLEYDYDRDKDRLEKSGYLSRMIPLFQVPGPDGKGSDAKIEGSIKGEGAVAQITPRLRELIEKSR